MVKDRDQDHSRCYERDHYILNGYCHPDMSHRLGDVRKCAHGKIQVLTQVDARNNLQGPGTHYWSDLSRFWNRKKYQQAEKILNENS